MNVLTLNLHREFFDAIKCGEKTVEYRDNAPYWQARLKRKKFTHVRFRNGYLPNAPEILVTLRYIIQTPDCFELHLGKLVRKAG